MTMLLKNINTTKLNFFSLFSLCLAIPLLVVANIDITMSPLASTLLIIALPLGLIGSVLVVKYYDRVFLFVCYLAPLYYLPFLSNEILSVRSFNTVGYWETFWLRAGKDVILVYLVLMWLMRVLLRQRLRISFNSVTYALIAFMVFGLLRSINPYAFGMVLGLRVFIEYTIFYFIAQDVLHDRRHVLLLVHGWIIISSVVSILGLMEFATGRISYDSLASGQIRITSTLFNSNALGWYLVWACSLALGLYVRLKSYQKRKRFFLIIVVALNSLAILLTGSRSSLILLLLMFVFILIWTGNVKLLFTAIFFLAPIAMGGIYLFQNISGEARLRAISYSTNTSGSFTSERFKGAQETFDHIFESNSVTAPIIGYGYTSEEIITNNNTDSLYLSLLYSGGIVGLLLISVIIMTIVKNFSVTLFNKDEIAMSLFLSVIIIIIMGLGSNILNLFPHACFFWISVGVLPQLKNQR